MTTPQDPARRKKQKRRREKQLATWRANQPNDVAKTGAVPADKPGKAPAPAERRG